MALVTMVVVDEDEDDENRLNTAGRPRIVRGMVNVREKTLWTGIAGTVLSRVKSSH